MAVTLPALPSPTVPLVGSDGKMHPEWFRFFVQLRAYLATL